MKMSAFILNSITFSSRFVWVGGGVNWCIPNQMHTSQTVFRILEADDVSAQLSVQSCISWETHLKHLWKCFFSVIQQMLTKCVYYWVDTKAQTARCVKHFDYFYVTYNVGINNNKDTYITVNWKLTTTEVQLIFILERNQSLHQNWTTYRVKMSLWIHCR